MKVWLILISHMPSGMKGEAKRMTMAYLCRTTMQAQRASHLLCVHPFPITLFTPFTAATKHTGCMQHSGFQC